MTLLSFFTVLVIWSLFNLSNNKKSPFSIFQHSKKEASIIVLPFKNFSDNQANQYFADGIMEDILNNLFHITALRVVSRTSAEQLHNGPILTNPELQSIIKKYTRDEKYLEEIQIAFNKNGINGIFMWLDDVNQHKPIKVEGMDGHPFYSAWWNAILGNKDETVYWLERTLEYPRPVGHYSSLITTNPDFDILRDDPRFLEILEKSGLTPYHKIKLE